MLEKHARTGRLVYVSGTLQTRRWRKDDEESDRFSTEIRLAPGGRVQFLDKPNGKNGNGAPAAQATGSDNGSDASDGVADPAPATQDDDDIPF